MVIELFCILTGCGHMSLHVLKLYTVKYTAQVKLGTSEEEQQIVVMSYSVERYCIIVLQDVITEKNWVKDSWNLYYFFQLQVNPQLSQ